MTPKELRRYVAATMEAWCGTGAGKGSKTHQDILRIYNAYSPLARGYKMKVTDDYCAATVSAAWIANGCAPYTGTECSCGAFIKIAQARGIWEERDDYRPGIGDAVIYDWEDTGKGDDTTGHDHIGIVISTSSGGFTVAEGNMSGGKLGIRSVRYDAKNLRGFIVPDYAAIAAAMEASDFAKAAVYWAAHEGIIQGNAAGQLRLHDAITKEQAVVMLYRMEGK